MDNSTLADNGNGGNDDGIVNWVALVVSSLAALYRPWTYSKATRSLG
jgi:hypothetical protein